MLWLFKKKVTPVPPLKPKRIRMYDGDPVFELELTLLTPQLHVAVEQAIEIGEGLGLQSVSYEIGFGTRMHVVIATHQIIVIAPVFGAVLAGNVKNGLKILDAGLEWWVSLTESNRVYIKSFLKVSL